MINYTANKERTRELLSKSLACHLNLLYYMYGREITDNDVMSMQRQALIPRIDKGVIYTLKCGQKRASWY